jgi:hypothetical protein
VAISIQSTARGVDIQTGAELLAPYPRKRPERDSIAVADRMRLEVECHYALNQFQSVAESRADGGGRLQNEI